MHERRPAQNGGPFQFITRLFNLCPCQAVAAEMWGLCQHDVCTMSRGVRPQATSPQVRKVRHLVADWISEKLVRWYLSFRSTNRLSVSCNNNLRIGKTIWFPPLKRRQTIGYSVTIGCLLQHPLEKRPHSISWSEVSQKVHSIAKYVKLHIWVPLSSRAAQKW